MYEIIILQIMKDLNNEERILLTYKNENKIKHKYIN